MYVHIYVYIYISRNWQKNVKLLIIMKKILLANMSNYIGCDVYFLFLEGLVIDNQSHQRNLYKQLLFYQLFKNKKCKIMRGAHFIYSDVD